MATQATKSTNLNETLQELNAGKITMEQLIEALTAKPAFVRTGSTFRRLERDGVSFVRGEMALVYTLGEKTDRDGNKVVVKPRKTKK